MEAALVKVKLANKLGCETKELTTVQIECPQGKLGIVIGKNGSMIKQIMDSTKVTIDVNKENNMIDITGVGSSVANAAAEINKITRAIEEEFEVPDDLIRYIATKNDVISKLREEYNGVHLDVFRNNKKAVLRGAPERVEELKKTILGIEVVSKDRTLAGREFSILLGKKGATIDQLVSKHGVSIEVNRLNEEVATALITGPPNLVDATLGDIEELMNNNREVSENLSVDPILKRILLADAGNHIKALQNKVNLGLKEAGGSCYLSLSKDRIDSDHPELSVKAKQSFISIAFELTESGMKELNALVVHLSVDPSIVPCFIGKGGETIKKLTQRKNTYVEVDRKTGKLSYGAATPEGFDEVHGEINELIANNQLLRVPAGPSLIRVQFKELNRSKAKAELSQLAWVDVADDNSCLILRGKKEDLEKAKEIVEEFLANNHIDEVAVTEEDFEALLMGGRNSKIMKFSTELGVTLFADRSNYVVTIRGTPEKVIAAKKQLDRFLRGGDGHSVAKLSITDQVVGVIVGKGGKTRKELEEEYGGLSINISKSNRVSIRGPEEKVAECRVRILKMVSSARVTQSLDVSEEQRKTLEKNGAIKRIIQQAPAHISIADGKATIRGFFYDVRDALCLLCEQLTGEYKSSIELDASQLSKVQNAARDPSHFERMESSTNTKVAIDLAAGSIVTGGKRSNVRKAKDQIFGFLTFLLPGEIERVKITKPLYFTVGQAISLAEISAVVGGTSVYLDRDISSIIIRSSDVEKVKGALALVNQKIKDAEKLTYVLEVQPEEAWLLPLIIGKNGHRISSLQQTSGSQMDVSKESRTVTVTGDSEEKVETAREALSALVDKARRENAFIEIPEKSVAAFVGKGGSKIKEFSLQHEVDVQRMRKGPAQLKISGDENKVEAAKKAIEEWCQNWGESHTNVVIPLEKSFIPVILGPKGETARLIQEEFGCKVDVDRQAMTIVIRGGNQEKRDNTVQKIQEIITTEKEAKADAAAQRKKNDFSNLEAVDETITKQRERSASPVDSDEENVRTNQFPVRPVGVQVTKNNGRRNKKVGSTVQTGTDQGRSLFQLLISEPMTDKVPDSISGRVTPPGGTDDETNSFER